MSQISFFSITEDGEQEKWVVSYVLVRGRRYEGTAQAAEVAFDSIELDDEDVTDSVTDEQRAWLEAEILERA